MNRTTKAKSAGIHPEQPQDKPSTKDDAKKGVGKDSAKDGQKPGEYPPLKEKYRNEPAAKMGMLLAVDEFIYRILSRKWADQTHVTTESHAKKVKWWKGMPACIVNSQRMEMIKYADVALSGRIRAQPGGFEALARGGMQGQSSWVLAVAQVSPFPLLAEIPLGW